MPQPYTYQKRMYSAIRGRKNRGKRTYKPRQKALKYNYRSVRKVKDVKKIVKRVLANQSETKVQVMDWTLNPLCLQNATATLGGNYVVLNPSNATLGSYTINRGTGSGQMVGDRIRLKSAVLEYVLTLTPFNATSNTQPRPVYLRAFIYKYKKSPQNDPQVTNICGNGVNANLFDIGTSDIGFVGTLTDLNQRLNTDAYTYYAHRTWKLGNSIPVAGVNNTTPLYTYANNDFKMSVVGKWNVTKYLPKIMERDDGGVWQDDYIILMFQVLSADNALIASAQQLVRADISIDLKYTDA